MSFALGRFAGEDGRPFLGLVAGDVVYDLGGTLGADARMIDLLRDWDERIVQLRKIADAPPDGGTPVSELRVLSPVEPTGQVLCAGANYFKHLREITLS